MHFLRSGVCWFGGRGGLWIPVSGCGGDWAGVFYCAGEEVGLEGLGGV